MRIVAIRDLHADRAQALASHFGLPPEIADGSRFYDHQPQSVHIVTAPAADEQLVEEALRHGTHVLVEKPPALTVRGCERLLHEAQERGLKVGVNESTAFEPLIRRGRSLIEAGRLGRLLQIDGFYALGLRGGETAAWPWASQLPGGMLEDLLPHLLTTPRALAGVPLVPEHWRLTETGQLPGHHDELRLLLSGEGGLTVNLALSLTTQPKAFTVTVRGTSATMAIDLRHMLLHASRPGSRDGSIAVGLELTRSTLETLWQTACNAVGLIGGYREKHGSFLPLIRAHYDALQADTELPAPLARATETIGIMRAIWPVV